MKKLKDFIVTTLSELEGTQLHGGTVHFDIALVDGGVDSHIYVPTHANENASRIQFDVSIKPAVEKEV